MLRASAAASARLPEPSRWLTGASLLSAACLTLTVADTVAGAYANPVSGALLGVSGVLLLVLLTHRSLAPGTVPMGIVVVPALLLATPLPVLATETAAVALALLVVLLVLLCYRAPVVVLATMAVLRALGVTADWRYGYAVIAVVWGPQGGQSAAAARARPDTAVYASTTYGEWHVPFVYGPAGGAGGLDRRPPRDESGLCRDQSVGALSLALAR